MKSWLVNRVRLTASEKDRIDNGWSIYAILPCRIFPKIKTSPKYDVLVPLSRLPPEGVRA